jgi:hypothetical protein
MCIVGRKRVPTQLKMHIFGRERLYFRGTANLLHKRLSCCLHRDNPNVREDRLLLLQRNRDI